MQQGAVLNCYISSVAVLFFLMVYVPLAKELKGNRQEGRPHGLTPSESTLFAARSPSPFKSVWVAEGVRGDTSVFLEAVRGVGMVLEQAHGIGVLGGLSRVDA